MAAIERAGVHLPNNPLEVNRPFSSGPKTLITQQSRLLIDRMFIFGVGSGYQGDDHTILFFTAEVKFPIISEYRLRTRGLTIDHCPSDEIATLDLPVFHIAEKIFMGDNFEYVLTYNGRDRKIVSFEIASTREHILEKIPHQADYNIYLANLRDIEKLKVAETSSK